jgi:hypothetical protein
MIRLLCFCLVLTVVACSGPVEVKNESASEVRITSQGNSLQDSDAMRSVCSDFQLTKEQVLTYYRESRPSTEAEIHDSFNILPCYSSGSILIDGEQFQWIIRAGGVGEFFNEQKKILRVCEGRCCRLTKGIC